MVENLTECAVDFNILIEAQFEKNCKIPIFVTLPENNPNPIRISVD